MTKYTADAHALPYPEGVDKVAVHGDIQALATKTGIAISTEGGRAEAAARDYASAELTKDRTRLGTLESAVPKALADAKTYADAELIKDRVRLGTLETTTVPAALTAAKTYADVELTKDRARLARTEAADLEQAEDIRQTLLRSLAYADSRAAEIQRALDTSHIALDSDGTPYYKPGSTSVKVLQDSDGTPFYEAT